MSQIKDNNTNVLSEKTLSQISGGTGPGNAAPQRIATNYTKEYENYCKECNEKQKNGEDLLTLPFEMWKKRKDNGQI